MAQLPGRTCARRIPPLPRLDDVDTSFAERLESRHTSACAARRTRYRRKSSDAGESERDCTRRISALRERCRAADEMGGAVTLADVRAFMAMRLFGRDE